MRARAWPPLIVCMTVRGRHKPTVPVGSPSLALSPSRRSPAPGPGPRPARRGLNRRRPDQPAPTPLRLPSPQTRGADVVCTRARGRLPIVVCMTARAAGTAYQPSSCCLAAAGRCHRLANARVPPRPHGRGRAGASPRGWGTSPCAPPPASSPQHPPPASPPALRPRPPAAAAATTSPPSLPPRRRAAATRRRRCLRPPPPPPPAPQRHRRPAQAQRGRSSRPRPCPCPRRTTRDPPPLALRSPFLRRHAPAASCRTGAGEGRARREFGERGGAQGSGSDALPSLLR